MTQQKIVILGTGPCGLGAAWRLQELKSDNFKIFEKLPHPGGLASSFIDEKGFTWDIGGHVQFSHYKYFDKIMDQLLKDEWVTHERESWVWIKERFVPYPFQNNIKFLSKEDMWQCLAGIIDLYKGSSNKPTNFKEWMLATFGPGISKMFLLPYNYKVWAYEPEKLSYRWVGERVSTPDLKRLAYNILFDNKDFSWGPNNTFRFPLKGGTGYIWKKLYSKIKKGASFGQEATELNTQNKYVKFRNGHVEYYDYLISTIPLDLLILMSDLTDKSPSKKLMHSSTHIFGIGLKGSPPKHLKTKCWIYFPEDSCPFYRATVFSNYSPYNVPKPNNFWSLMVEISESPDKVVKRSSLRQSVINGLLNTNLITSRNMIVDVWYHFEPYGYPTPSLQRDDALKILRTLENLKIFSRGRFGGWKYEASNQDHTFMQGVEVIDKILMNKKEVTLWYPDKINSLKK